VVVASEIWPSRSRHRRLLQRQTRRHAGERNAGVEPGRQHVDQHQRGHGRLRGVVDAGVETGDVDRQQVRRHPGAHQLAAQQHAQDDRGDGEALDPAVGLDQL